MSDKKQIKGYVKTETLLLSVSLALVLGFIAGVAFTVYRSAHNPMLPPAGREPAEQIEPAKISEIKKLQDRVARSPEDVRAWTELAHLYFDTGQREKAIKAYEKSLSLEPARPDIWVDLGVMYRRQGKIDKAVECFDKALEIDPGHKIALYNKGVVLMHDRNDARGAIEAWSTLVRIDPEAETPGGMKIKTLLKELEKRRN